MREKLASAVTVAQAAQLRNVDPGALLDALNDAVENEHSDNPANHQPAVITSPCIDVLDIACQDVYPVDCICYEPGVDRMLYIEPDECIDCAACEPVCPVIAIFAEDDVPDSDREFTELNALYFQDREAARRRVEELAERTLSKGGWRR